MHPPEESHARGFIVLLAIVCGYVSPWHFGTQLLELTIFFRQRRNKWSYLTFWEGLLCLTEMRPDHFPWVSDFFNRFVDSLSDWFALDVHHLYCKYERNSVDICLSAFIASLPHRNSLSLSLSLPLPLPLYFSRERKRTSSLLKTKSFSPTERERERESVLSVLTACACVRDR